MLDLLTHALAYAKRGWMVLPLKPGAKVPLTPNGFKDATTNENIITRWWDRHPDANIGIATGKDSGFWVLDVDNPDGDASLAKLEDEMGTLPRTLEQATGGGGRQFLFRWPSREVRNKQGLRPGIDVRAEGGYVVVPPSLHPSGRNYEWADGKDTIAIADAPPGWLEFVAPARRVLPPWERLAPPAPPPPPPVAVTHAPILDRARKYLAQCEPAIQGNGGHDSLLWAARALVVGFELDDSTALGLLWSDYNPRCTPPWDRGRNADVRDFERKVGQARWTTGDKPRGWLLDECGLRASTERLAQIGRESAVNLLSQPSPAEDANAARGTACRAGGAGKPVPPPASTPPAAAAVGAHPARPVGQVKADPGDLPRVDPGPFPSRLLSIPGFINELKAVSLAGAPYPNETAAFAGALAMLSFLTGRKIRTDGDARTNLFVLLLAASGSGKDYPRRVNAALLHELLLVDALGDSFASAEGIEDALVSTPEMLYQSDEISEYLASVAADKEGRWRRIQATLLRLYSTASSVFSLRRKAGQEGGSHVNQPHFVLFGTAVPSVCYAAVSETMLTGGFLSRCIILEAGPRGTGQPPRAVEIPAALLEVATFWRDYHPGGDLGMVTAQPAVVPATEDAVRALADFTRFVDDRYAAAEAAGDEVLMAVWSRALEHTHKLALLYAASVHHKVPTITEPAVAWAREFVMHHTRRLLWLGKSCIADSPYQKESQRVLGILRRAGGELLRSEFLKRSKLGVKDFDGIARTLIETGQIQDALREHTGGRPGLVYTIGEG